MWFNNIQLYRFTQPFTLDAKELSEKLEKFSFKPCGKLQPASYGWVPPLGKHGLELIHVTNGNIMLCAQKQEKILPASVVKEFVDEKVAELEESQARKVRRKERDTIKDDVIQDLLPKAFARNSLIFAFIAPQENMILVNSSSRKKAEELLVYLRRSLGSLAVIPPALIHAPSSTMTRWVSGEAIPVDILVNDECELHDTEEEGGIIRCKRQDLEADEIQAHLKAGKQVVKLSINWQESLSCIISEDFSIKRIKFSDEIIEQADSEGADDFASQFDEDFAIMALELKRFIPRLIEVFGGEDPSAYKNATEAFTMEEEMLVEA